MGGPGRDHDGNFFLGDFEMQAAPADKPSCPQKIVYKVAVTDESQSSYSFENLVNDKSRPKGWGIDTSDDKSTTTRRGVLIPDKPFGFAAGTVKLDKAGGILEAFNMLQMARALGLKTMLGCMVSSSVSVTAAAHLSPGVGYADLDGNLLIANDPFSGVQVKNGKLLLPDRPGLGLQPA